jgi:ribose transport system substrate-binding protein
MARYSKVFGLLGASICGGLMLGAVGPSGSASAEDACAPHDIDLGGGVSVKSDCKPLRIAFLSAATNNVYLQAGIKGAQDAAKKYGVTVDMFDANWSPATQFNQAQNAISSGKYQAILAEMNDGNQACAILSKDAPAKNILVAIANDPLCGRAANEGDDLWQPGTLSFIGGSQGKTAFRDWVMAIAAENPGPQKVAVITGPDLAANTINMDSALKDAREKYPDFKVVGVIRTDYSVLQGNSKALPLLQAHPDLTILISNYSDMTRGALQAVKQAGMADKLKVYDYGGNTWAFEALKAGAIGSTRMLTPYTEMYKGVEALANAWQGKPVPRFIPLVTSEVTKANIDQIKPEY